ncbi:MAG: response regulator [Exilibacterium sp.]
MLQIFVPQLKVQKDRNLMRDTDFRMAKYSRRGIVLNFFAFLMCLAAGSFYEQAHQLAVMLTVGLLLITLLRGYFLFRFDSLYARAPARWRNQYFMVSFLGAAWWSFILVSVTWVVGMRDETPLLWLYTIVFYSATSNAFAPYRLFLTYYHFIGQVPTAIAAILLGTLDGYLYGTMMLVFYLMLNHQGRSVADAYWDRLEANYALRQKAKNLEVEKRDTQAVVELNNEFMTNLGHELRTSLNDVIGALSLLDDSELDPKQRELLTLAAKASERQLGLVNNVMDFSRIATKELVLDTTVFNLRRLLEAVVEELAIEAHQQGVELDFVLDRALPQRVRGDAVRLSQILTHLISNAIKFSEQGEVVMEAVFHRQTDMEGELEVFINDEGRGMTVADQQELFNAFAKLETTQAGTGLGLAICKGLAECMGGSAGMTAEPGLGNQLWLKVRLQIAGKQSAVFKPHPKLRGNRCLLLDVPSKIEDSLLRELEPWGLAMEVVKGHNEAWERLERALSEHHPFDLLLLYNSLQNLKGIEFSKALCANAAMASLKQIIAVSGKQALSPEVEQLLKDNPQVAVIHKPLRRDKLYETFKRLLLDADTIKESEDGIAHDHGQGIGQHVLLVEDHRVNQMVAEGMLKKLGYSVTVASNGREALTAYGERRFDVVLMDCQMPEMDGYMATREIRNRELARESTKEPKQRVPIIAMTAHAAEGDQARCLAAGMDDYLAKPVRYDQLETRLKRWLGGGPVEEEPRKANSSSP